MFARISLAVPMSPIPTATCGLIRPLTLPHSNPSATVRLPRARCAGRRSICLTFRCPRFSSSRKERPWNSGGRILMLSTIRTWDFRTQLWTCPMQDELPMLRPTCDRCSGACTSDFSHIRGRGVRTCFLPPREHLVSLTSGSAWPLSLAAHGGFRGVVTFGTKLGDTGPSPGKENAMKDGTTAAALMFHGTSDEESPPAAVEVLCKQLPHCSFYPVAGAIHNFENWHPDQWDWKEELTAWLRRDRRGLWKDIVYDRPEGRELLMDAFIPQGHKPLPAVIIVHGGGLEAGNKGTYVSPLFEPLAEAGFAWFSIDYRLTPYVHIPEQLEDVRAAIRYVGAHADRFHIDPNRIALLGESASGQLVAQVSSELCTGCEVQAVVSFYGVYDFTKWADRSESE